MVGIKKEAPLQVLFIDDSSLDITDWGTLLTLIIVAYYYTYFTGIIGLIGNTLSIVILSKPDMYNSFNNLLITLSTMDSVFIVLAIFDYSVSR